MFTIINLSSHIPLNVRSTYFYFRHPFMYWTTYFSSFYLFIDEFELEASVEYYERVTKSQ